MVAARDGSEGPFADARDGHDCGSAPLVSVVVPTMNSSRWLSRCLGSIRAQTYRNIELIVVDGGSNDDTVAVASVLADRVLVRSGGERCVQVNFGVAQSSGDFVYKVDSDFELAPGVIEECVARAADGCDAVVVHNSPAVDVSWIARLREFEVNMYKYDLTHSSARFVRRDVFAALGGFNEDLVAGEDYDFQNRLNRAGYVTGFADAEAIHLGEPERLLPHLRKYFNYGASFVAYRRMNPGESATQLKFMRPVFIRNWSTFAKHPLTAAAFLGYNVMKYASGGAGYLLAVRRRRREIRD